MARRLLTVWLSLLLACGSSGGTEPAPGSQGGLAGAGQGGQAGQQDAGPGDPSALPPEAVAALAGATHLIVVQTASWASTAATLSLHRRGGGGWQRELGPFDAVVGAKGLSWGRGLTQPPEGAERIKQEGDKTAPAGLFRMGPAMGYAAAPPDGVEVPYTQAVPGMVCVDDAASGVYNTIQPGPGAWASSEPMKRGDGLYELLMLVDHNRLVEGEGAIPGGGSCIFLHVWGGPGSSTAGCTALDRDELAALVAALASLETTVLVQLPEAEYATLAGPWGLPSAP